MPPRENYQHALEQVLDTLPRGRRLLLHSCCAPCSSYVLEYLSEFFEIMLFYYNPNIVPAAEYQHRLAEQERLLRALPTTYPVTLLAGDYDPAAFSLAMRGTEQSPEGGTRCRRCIALRLREAAAAAVRLQCDYFATTLTISPHKDAPYINTCGAEIAAEFGVRFLPSDFKKRGGFQRSIALSQQYGLYRQDFCGCAPSRLEADARREAKENLR